MIPKLPASEAPSETLIVIRAELDFVQRKLRQHERTRSLSDQLPIVFERLVEFERRSKEADVEEHEVAAFLFDVNEMRCLIFGELTSIACREGLEESWVRSFFRQPAPSLSPASRRSERLCGPTSAEEWMQVANERALDARIMHDGKRASGAIYLVGYVLECNLKALLRAMGKTFQTSGREGHDVRGLWEASGYKLSDLRDDGNGAKTFFVQTWSTDLRYETIVGREFEPAELMNAALALAGWIQTRARREIDKRTKRRR